jgi:hypothetical protein
MTKLIRVSGCSKTLRKDWIILSGPKVLEDRWFVREMCPRGSVISLDSRYSAYLSI